jgi:uncharacterized membrane protein
MNSSSTLSPHKKILKILFRIENIYALLALFFGLLFIFVTPPVQSPDEAAHFSKALHVSSGHLYSNVSDSKNVDTSPVYFEDFLSEEYTSPGDFSKDWPASKIIDWQYTPSTPSGDVERYYATADAFSPAYIVPALGIVLARITAHVVGILSTPTGLMFYFARLTTLLFSVFIIRYAIKRTPIFKKTMALASLIPTTLFICSMVSYDNILIAFSLLFFALFFDLLFSKRPARPVDIILLILSGVFLANIKLMYAAFLILLFFIPKQAFHGKKIRYLLIIFGGIIATTFLYNVPIMLNGTTVAGMLSTPEAQQQADWMLAQPFNYAFVFMKNLIDQRSYYLNSTVGLLGNADAFNPMIINLLVYVAIIIMAIAEGKTDLGYLKIHLKVINLFCSVFCVVAIFAALYIGFTAPQLQEIGGDTIIGVQGRYFIPLLLPLLSIFSMKQKSKRPYYLVVKLISFFIIFLSLTMSLFTLLIRFWS